MTINQKERTTNDRLRVSDGFSGGGSLLDGEIGAASLCDATPGASMTLEL